MSPLTEHQNARLFLSCATEPPTPAVAALIDQHGVFEAVDRIRGRAAPADVLAEITIPNPDLRPATTALQTGATRLLTPEDPDWPHQALGNHTHTPLALWVRGTADLTVLTRQAVAVLGSRAATAYGEHVATTFGHDLARAGITVVTGGGYGIGTAALRGALVAHPPRPGTIVVLPCDLARPSPQGTAALLDQVLQDNGILLGEYPPGTPPARYRFARRHQLVAALTAATVIVEAGARSGVQPAVHAAHRHDRPVYAVPGPITSANSTGTTALLRSGHATAIDTIRDLDHDVITTPAGEDPCEAALEAVAQDTATFVAVHDRVAEVLPTRGVTTR